MKIRMVDYMVHKEVDENSITPGSGNIFADLDLPNAEERWAKVELASRIFKAIKDRRLTQKEAGEMLGISQPKVSALLKGNLKGFSTDRLFRFLTILGCDVKIVVSRPHPQNAGHVVVAVQ